MQATILHEAAVEADVIFPYLKCGDVPKATMRHRARSAAYKKEFKYWTDRKLLVDEAKKKACVYATKAAERWDKFAKP